MWFVDVTQNVDCAHWSGKVGTQAQGSKWYSFQLDSVLSSKDCDCCYNSECAMWIRKPAAVRSCCLCCYCEEMCELHGFPVEWPDGMSEGVKMGLIGESVHIGNLGAVLYFIYLQIGAPWFGRIAKKEEPQPKRQRRWRASTLQRTSSCSSVGFAAEAQPIAEELTAEARCLTGYGFRLLATGPFLQNLCASNLYHKSCALGM